MNKYELYRGTLIIVGVTLLMIGILPMSPLGIYGADTLAPQIVNVNPPGTEESPSSLHPGSTLTIFMDVIENMSGIDSAQVKINSTVLAEYETLYLENITTVVYSGDASRYAVNWTVPSGRGVTYMFEWKVTDKSNNVAFDYSYGVTGTLSEGIFSINGYSISDVETLWLINATDVIIGYWCASAGINKVIIKFYNETESVEVELIKSSGNNWETVLDFSDEGKYSIEGYVETTTGEVYKELDIMLNFGAGPLTIGRILTIQTIYRISLTLIGVTMIYFGIKGRKVKIR